MAQRGLWNIAKKVILEDRGAFPKNEGESIREYEDVHEDHVLSGWLREDAEGEAE